MLVCYIWLCFILDIQPYTFHLILTIPMRNINIPLISSLVYPIRSVFNIFAPQSVDSPVVLSTCVLLITALNNAAFASNSSKNISVNSCFVLSKMFVSLMLFYMHPGVLSRAITSVFGKHVLSSEFPNARDRFLCYIRYCDQSTRLKIKEICT